MEEKDYLASLENVKIPVLVLDQKWHRLFALNGKPMEVLELEKAEKDLLQRQGELSNEIKELKVVKNKLRKSVMENMDGAAEDKADPDIMKRREQDRRLLDETNEKIAADEEELLELPEKIKETNLSLMERTMEFCYGKMRSNTAEAREITDWIQKVRVDLKKNIIRKQNREINNREMYHYMYGIFGPDVLDLFDLTGDADFSLEFLDEKSDEEKKMDAKKAEKEKARMEQEKAELEAARKKKDEEE